MSRWPPDTVSGELETFIKIDDPIGAEGGQMERKVQAVERLV
jgi:hypothetical protein